MAHLGVKKMYADMKALFFWNGMKKDVIDYVVRFLECKLVRDEWYTSKKIVITTWNSWIKMGGDFNGF